MIKHDGLIIIGAGGHAKVVLSTALALSETVLGLVDDNDDLFEKSLQGYAVLGRFDLLKITQCDAVFGLGNNTLRKTIAQRFGHLTWKTLVHPSAFVHPSVTLGEGTVVFAGAQIQPDAKIGKHCIINTGATIDHDCVIEDYVHLAPGVHLAGNVQVGEAAFLGIGSVAIPGVCIGQGVTVAAGAVVVNDIAAQKMVMGIPAKERIL